jgi:DNA recombination protein RmuC
MDGVIAVMLALAALIVGLALGWYAASRAAQQGAARAEQLQKLLDAVTAERDEAMRGKAALEADARNFDARMTELREAKDMLVVQFREIGDKLLEKAQQDFLAKADDRIAKADKEQSTKLQSLLQPVEATLKRYEEGLQRVEKERVGSYEALQLAVSQLVQGNDQVRKETQRLANVMSSSPKARGRWGEEHLKNILESAGLAENIDFALQATVSDGDKKLRPDCIINLPGDRCIVVDVKNVWTAFEQAFDEEDPQRRSELLKQHSEAMRISASELSRKGYWRQFERSPEFVVMFIPGEHILSAAAERAPEMIATAFRNGVIIASTINMLALAKFLSGMWRQEALAAQAKEVAEVGKELYKRLAVMGGHVAKLGRNLGLATGAYNDFVGSLESQVMTQAKRFETLKVETGGKNIEAMPILDVVPRPLAKLTVVRDDDSDSEPPQRAAE